MVRRGGGTAQLGSWDKEPQSSRGSVSHEGGGCAAGAAYFGSVRLPPWAAQAFLVRALKPWPLHSFWPLQL